MIRSIACAGGLFVLLFLPLVPAWGESADNTQVDRPKTAEDVLPMINHYCGACHKVPPPAILPKHNWPTVIDSMAALANKRFGREFIPEEHLRDIKALYYGSSPAELKRLPYIDQTSDVLTFAPTEIGNRSVMPLILNIQPFPQASGKPAFLVCDGESSQVLRLDLTDQGWQETVLASVAIPIQARVVDFYGKGRNDILVADLGEFPPNNTLAGKIYLLREGPEGRYTREILLEGLGRVADVQALDLDQDGDLDIAVAVFGGGDIGEIFWLENVDGKDYVKHDLLQLSGALNLTPADLNGDGKPDLVSLVAQEHEMVVAFINKGQGRFETHNIASAHHPMYGSTSMTLVDLDKDGDIDIIFTNGDAYDTQTDPKPYHGVQWLENKGDLNFVFHEIGRFYGAAKAVVGDVDGDGDLDIVVSSWVNDWDDAKRQALVWYENNGRQTFTPRPLAGGYRGIVSLVLADLSGNGRLDLLAGAFRMDLLAGEFAGNDKEEQTTGLSASLTPRFLFFENRALKGKQNVD